MSRLTDIITKYQKFIAPDFIEISCPVGWYPLLEEIFEYCEKQDYQIQVMQVKEKYAELRVYYNVQREWIEEHDLFISSVIEKSGKMCQVCGENGTSEGSTGWLTTLCDNHRKNPNTGEKMYEEESANFDWMRFRFDRYRTEYNKLKNSVAFEEDIVSGFWENEYPEFRQGIPTHGLEDILTADQANGLVQTIKRLEEEIADLKGRDSQNGDY